MGSWSPEPDTFWLNFTNFALGLVTLEACLWVAWGVEQEVVFRRRLRRATAAAGGLALLLAFVLAPSPAGATVEMQNEAKKLGIAVKNCLDCHASPHAVDVMHQKAKDLKMADGNCLACHGGKIPIGLNQRGEWLVAEKGRRGAKECDMAWLKDYKEPVAPKAPAARPGAKPTPKPETIELAPKP
jgi:Zn-finger protein